jgi:signal transduction histidine kinase
MGFENQNFLIKTDSKRLQQVFLNIISNAVKFTDRNGKIILVFEKITENDKSFLRISVSDNGAGIKTKD